MVVGFTTAYAISAYHHSRCEFEFCSGKVYSIQHYVIKFVSDLLQVVGFLHQKNDCHDITEIPKHAGPTVRYKILGLLYKRALFDL